MRKAMLLFAVVGLCLHYTSSAQNVPTEYGSGLKVDLSDDGQKYFRLITWHQAWLTGAQNSNDEFQITPRLRRSRLLMFAQLSDRFLILTHFGLNNLTPAGLDPVGFSSQAQLFMHDAWVEFKVTDNIYLGSGLHYWNGISRLTNQSTLNIMPLDNTRMAWATIGTTDQFARHLGVYAKGKVGKLDYRVAWNKAAVNSLDQQAGLAITGDQAVYRGAALFGGKDAGNIYQGYFMYQFLDQESNKLPYLVGTYLGKKTVFNIGAGFYTHTNGSVTQDAMGDTIGHNVSHFGFDAFYDAPIGNEMAISALAAYYLMDYGPNYQLAGSSQVIASGNGFYGQVGLLLPAFTKIGRWQPYVTYLSRGVDALDGNYNHMGLGANYFISGHNAKVSLEYRNASPVAGENTSQWVMQAMIFL
ncbi:porin [Cryomorphaceae bacterium]|nr:porin [Cryomorphaceae bacterium]